MRRRRTFHLVLITYIFALAWPTYMLIYCLKGFNRNNSVAPFLHFEFYDFVASNLQWK
jgi:hypothetical protein